MNSITIDLNNINNLAREGSKFVFTPHAEEAILQLLEVRDLIEEKIKEVEDEIARAGLSIDESFSGVVGTKLTASYRTYGEKYTYELGMRDELLSQGWLKQNVTHKVVSADVDKYFNKEGKLPEGVVPKPRAPKLSFSKRSDKLSKQNEG